MPQTKVSFMFDNKIGYLIGDFVLWGGCGFQIEAAGPSLRQAIDKARRRN